VEVCDRCARPFFPSAFAQNPKHGYNNLPLVHPRQSLSAKVPGLLCLETSKQLAAQRIRQMDELLANLEASSFGYF
jgi:hypothetical protein